MFKKLCRLFLFIITIFMVINVKANAINEIEMNVYLDDGGNATVEEIWNANLTQGTEGYQAFSNLNNITISNFSVMDDLGNMYESLSSWNTKGTFSDKRYKSGINYTFDGLELCWGISNYGSRKYTLKYKINNLVTQYTDNQGLYFNFLNLNQEVGKVKITIHADFLISLDNTRIWSFGNNGTINFDNGKIVMESKSGLTSSQYVVIMVKFNENVFSTTSISSKSFDNIYDEAFENNNSSNNSKINNMLLKLLLIIGGVFIFIPTLLFLVLRKIFGKIKLKDYSNGNHGKYLHFGKDGKKLPKEVSYWREIPCYKNINYAFWICDEFYLVDNDNLIKGLIGAYLLKWFKNDVIKIINSNGKYLIDVSNELVSNDSVEKVIYYIITKAAGENRILEPKEFKIWARLNYDTIYNLGNVINSYVINYLIIKGDLVRKSSNTAFDFEIKSTIREEAIRVKGLIRYLNDFSLIREKEHIEVKLWDEYMIFAELFGVADKVREEFRKLYPDIADVNERMLLEKLDLLENIVTDISTACISGARTGYNRSVFSRTFSGSSSSHDYSGSSSSSGGGGSSFSSGGSSSGGSSGGGFR